MEKQRKTKFTRSLEERMRREIIFINNPVLVEGLGLAPVIMAALTLKNAAILALGVLIIATPTRFIGNLLIGYIPQRLRSMVYAMVASLVYIPALMAIRWAFGADYFTVGIYLPMLVVDSLMLSRTEIPSRESVGDSLRNGIATSIGFAVVVLLVGGLREALSVGKLWGMPLPLIKTSFALAGTAAGGFIITALLAALLQWAISAVKRNRYRGAKRDDR